MSGPPIRKGRKRHLPERHDATDAPVLSNFRYRLATRQHRTIRADDRDAATHDIVEREKTARQDQPATRPVAVEPRYLFRDSGIAGEDPAMPPDCGVWGKTASKQLTSATGIALREGLVVGRKNLQDSGNVRCRGIGRCLHAT